MKNSELELAKRVAKKAKELSADREAKLLANIRAEFYTQLSEVLISGKVTVANWHIGDGIPAVSLGNASDIYIDASTAYVWLNKAGEWVKTLSIKGESGKDGDNGKDGVDGKSIVGKDGYTPVKGKDYFDGARGKEGIGKDGRDGKDGSNGKDGKNGADGSKWYTGRTRPNYEIGAVGDFYLANNGDYYEKTSGVIWELRGSLKGASGPSGDGREVELQVNATHIQWRYVGSASWTNLVALSTLTGANGTNGTNGQGVPIGGSVGQILSKINSTDYNTQWSDLSKTSVGLANVDNTTDADKPVSTAQQTALNLKANNSRLINTTAPLSGGGDLSGDRTLTTSMATNRLIGRSTAGAGVMQEITLGTNLSFTGTTLNAASSPAGATTQIQFNNAGAFGADADLAWNSTNNALILSGLDTEIDMTGVTTEPASPSAGVLRIYSKNIGGRMSLKTRGPIGVDTPIQNALWGNNIVMWNPSSATAGVWFATMGTATSSGTYTVGLPTTTSIYTTQQRGRYANVVTTLNQVLGIRQSTSPTYFLGSVANRGGFFFFCRMGFDVFTNGSRMFVGLTASLTGTNVSDNPSTIANSVGFCIDAADNGLISFLMRGAAATKTSTGFTAVTGKGYDLYMFASANSTTVNYLIIDTNVGTEASGTVSVNPPAVNTMMVPVALASNAALTPVTSVHLGINRIYIETDY